MAGFKDSLPQARFEFFWLPQTLHILWWSRLAEADDDRITIFCVETGVLYVLERVGGKAKMWASMVEHLLVILSNRCALCVNSAS